MANTFSQTDAGFMRGALALARRGQGAVEPNPMVGAVVVRDGKVVGEGYHHRFGGLHAEIFALLENLGGAGERAKGATLYVTLEPCCHWGKTPPCTQSIIAAGIKRVVAGMIDPFSAVHGKGVAALRQQGIRVDVGLLEEEARALNAPFITRLTKNRPYMIAKWAQSLDGCVATAKGESRWISSETSRAWVHGLRGRVDGILVGIGTALTDDPLLTARPAAGRGIKRIATRIVVDAQCRLPMTSRLVLTIADAPVLLAHAQALTGEARRRQKALSDRGVMMVELPLMRDRKTTQQHVRMDLLLAHLAQRDYSNVLVEGGPELMGSLFQHHLIDKAHVFVAPMILGGKNAKRAVGGQDAASLAEALRMRNVGVRRSGADLHLEFKID